MRDTPRACVAKAMNCACMSVAKPGYSSVVTSAATSFFAPRTRSAFSTLRSDRHAAFLEFIDHGGEVLGLAAGDQEVAAGDGSGDQKSSSLDAVGNDGMSGAMQLFNSLDADG